VRISNDHQLQFLWLQAFRLWQAALLLSYTFLMYKNLVRPLLFSFDSESVHNCAIGLAKTARFSPVKKAVEALYHFEALRLEVNTMGLKFASPIGLAAGFDKNCEAVDFFSALGFSFIEVGSITSEPQEGNPRPRIFRLVKDGALINRMGFPGGGVDAVLPRLVTLQKKSFNTKVGINIGKAKSVPVDEALNDYLHTFNMLKDYGDYFVLNVSSPNTPELRKLQEKARLSELLRGLSEANKAKRPLLVKVAPDLTHAELDDVLECCLENSVAGVIATNTTFSREGLSVEPSEVGGMSGKPLHKLSLEMIRHIHSSTQGKICIVGVGGVFSAKDVVEMLRAGASLVQIYTGLIYEGPSLVLRLKKDLLSYMDEISVKSLQEIVGKPY